MKTNPGISRRQFVAGAASTAFAFDIIPSRLLGAEAPSNKLNIAGIGVGGMGAGNLNACRNDNIVALCDVDEKYAGKTFKKYAGAKVYKDYRVMLEKQKDIDAVVIATPDHTHAVITMAAMQAGKHVYLPEAAHSYGEGSADDHRWRRKKYKVQTQMGNQGHSSEPIRLLREWVQSGSLGDVKEVHAWSDRPIGKPWYANFAVRDLPTQFPAVPDTLDWDLWLGPAKDRKYHPCVRAVQMARLAGLRNRRARRHGLPHSRSGLLGAGPGPSDQRSRGSRTRET